MLWHFFLIHDDYGKRVAEGLNMSVEDARHLPPLAGRQLTDEDQRRLANLGNNGDGYDESLRGRTTTLVDNGPTTAEEVLPGMPQKPVAPEDALADFLTENRATD